MAVVVDPRKIRSFASADDFERWLAAHHEKESEVFLRISKKGADVASVSYAEALDVALCWGWIDAVRKAYDAQSFLQRFTRRTAKSGWSKINREHVARLHEAGRMTAHGHAQVEAAKADGRWAAAYDGSASMQAPEDLLAAVRKNARAQKTFEQLDKKNLYALAYRLSRLKTPAGREKRIADYVQMLARGETLHPMRAAKART